MSLKSFSPFLNISILFTICFTLPLPPPVGNIAWRSVHCTVYVKIVLISRTLDYFGLSALLRAGYIRHVTYFLEVNEWWFKVFDEWNTFAVLKCILNTCNNLVALSQACFIFIPGLNVCFSFSNFERLSKKLDSDFFF